MALKEDVEEDDERVLGGGDVAEAVEGDFGIAGAGEVGQGFDQVPAVGLLGGQAGVEDRNDAGVRGRPDESARSLGEECRCARQVDQAERLGSGELTSS